MAKQLLLLAAGNELGQGSQISLHGFNLPQWVAENGPEAYVSMLQAIGELEQVTELHFVEVIQVRQHPVVVGDVIEVRRRWDEGGSVRVNWL